MIHTLLCTHLCSVNRFTPSSIVICEVTALAHEARNNTASKKRVRQTIRHPVARPQHHLYLFSPIYFFEAVFLPMEGTSRKSKASLTSTKLTKVLGSFRNDIRAEFKCDPTDVVATHFHIEVNYNMQFDRKRNESRISKERKFRVSMYDNSMDLE